MKNLFKFVVLILFSLILTVNFGAAQTKQTSADVQREQIKKLDFLTGNWGGEGWMMFGRERKTFTIDESVQTKLDGLVILIEGIGKISNKTVHHALALVSYDPNEKDFEWSSYILSGEKLNIKIEVSDKSLVWGFHDERAGGDNRYLIKLDENGNWIEKGEFSKDGKSWFQFFGMKLHKVK